MKLTSETKLLLAMAVFVLLGGGALFFLSGSNAPAASRPGAPPPPKITRATFDGLVTNARHVKGDPNAPVTIVEFADFQCPSCRRAFGSIVHRFDKEVPVRFAFHHFPLTNIHERAVPAAIASEAAGRQGKFWPMYEKLFTGEKTELTDAYFDIQAKRLGLDMDRFHKDQKDPALEALVMADQKLATENSVQETPTFLIQDNRKPDAEIQSVVGGSQLQGALAVLLPKSVKPVAGATPGGAPLPGPQAPG
ncbi:MAG: thioredoxin domain-containing protein [Cytophagales bacterium]|nr:thioredoxin domain-containing protein [Armatimonadota bacterium]